MDLWIKTWFYLKVNSKNFPTIYGSQKLDLKWVNYSIFKLKLICRSIMITRKSIDKQCWQKRCHFLQSWSWKYTIIQNHDHELTWRKCETHFKSPKPFHFIPNLIKILSSSPPPSPTLKKNLLPLIFSLKFLQKSLEIGLNTSGNNLGAGFFMVKPIRRWWWIVNPKGILEDLPFPSFKR